MSSYPVIGHDCNGVEMNRMEDGGINRNIRKEIVIDVDSRVANSLGNLNFAELYKYE
jgi:hypothetical protein